MAVTAADVPGRYDVVVSSAAGTYGYMLLDSLEESIPFRTHRAVYGQTQPFVERSNVSNSYGDNAQDFFLTIRQRDWSLGEQQQFFRAGQDGRYWHGTNVDVATPGKVKLTQQTPSLSFAATAIGGCGDDFNGDRNSVLVATATTLYRVQVDGTITSLGAHGLGAAPFKYGAATDGVNGFFTTTTAGTVGVRMWNGASFSTFSATGSDSLCVVNNTLYGYDGADSELLRYDNAGGITVVGNWKSANGNAGTVNTNINIPILHPFGGKVLLCFPYAQEAAELWIYDGTGVSRLEVFPPNFVATSMDVLYGVAYIGGIFYKPTSTTTMVARPAVLFYDGTQIGLLWQADAYGSSAITSSSYAAGPGPVLGINDGRLLFTDETMSTINAYNPASGSVSTIGSYAAGGTSPQMISTGAMVLMTRTQTQGYYFPHATSYNTSGTVISSLIDFDSSLAKQFRGVTVEFDPASDGDGGTVDIGYQTDSLTGAWTTLQSGAVSGTQYTFSNISGHSIAIRVTLNKSTSTAGPTLKSMSVRGAPIMPRYRRGEYILDCTNADEQERELRDGSFHPLAGYDQVTHLLAACSSTTPLTITDRFGTYTGFIDVNDAEGFDIYEVKSGVATIQPTKSGSFVVRFTAREI